MKPEDLIKSLMGDDKDMDELPTVVGHYGWKTEKYTALVGEFIGIMMCSTSKTDNLDKIFPKMTPDQKIKIFAYLHATEVLDDAVRGGRK